MKARIFSKVGDQFGSRSVALGEVTTRSMNWRPRLGRQWITGGVLLLVGAVCCSETTAQTPSAAQTPATGASGLMTDPQTGIVYRKVSKVVERPVIESKMETQNRTVYRPETVTESKPETRTVYTPVVEYKWKPRLHGRWNPFQQPTIAYHHVPETRWEARNQLVNRTETRTQWVAENRTVAVPRQQVRMQREEKTEFEVVGRVAAPGTQSPTSAIASRLRPLDQNATVAPLGSSRIASTFSTPVYTAPSFAAPQIAASTVGRMTSDPPRRGIGQSGMRANDLHPSSPVHGQALPAATGGVGIATLPSLPFIR